MTAQASDGFDYGDQHYSIAGVRGRGLFEPKRHKLRPVSRATLCWRGYTCRYAMQENRLILVDLRIGLNQSAPVLFGIEPEVPKSQHPIFNAIYTNINHPIGYTGGLLIATGFIQELYVHMGFHPAWKYEEVHELIFEDGTLKDAFDRSEYMADFRKRREAAIDAAPDERREPTKAEIGDWIERCFSLEYHGLF